MDKSCKGEIITMVKTKDEILEAIKAKIGEEISDEDVSLLEDVTDTLNDFENKSKAETNTDWKAKYEENDKEWRKRYTDRFFNKGDEGEENKGGKPKGDLGGDPDGENDDPEEPTTFEELFKEGE